MKIIVNSVLGTLFTCISYLLGGFDLALKSLLLLIIIDYATGVLKAIYNKSLSSKIGARGIIKKVGYLFVVALSVIVDNLVGADGMVRTLIIYFFTANEGLSIIENWAGMGLKTPKALTDLLNQLKKEEGE